MGWINEVHKQGRRVHSQGKQDGIIEYIFKNIGVTNKFCVEFGFNSNKLTGGSGPNTANLVVKHGWDHVYFDGDHDNPKINLHRAFLTPSNIVECFSKHSVPKELDFLSIDVDSTDLWLWKALLEGDYRPRLVSIEYNSHFPLCVNATCPPNFAGWKGDQIYGASLLALNILATEFDYKLVAVEPKLDAFFVRGDLVDETLPLESFASYTNVQHHPKSKLSKEDVMQQYHPFM